MRILGANNIWDHFIVPNKPVTSVVKHLKWFRVGCFPLKITESSFSEISIPYLLYSLVLVVTHLYFMAITVTMGLDQGPFTAVLLVLERLVYAMYYPGMIILVLSYRRDFDRTVKKLMELQKSLMIEEYVMFSPIKLSASAIGFIIVVFMAQQVKYYLQVVTDTSTILNIILFWMAICSSVSTTVIQTANSSVFCYFVCCVRSCFDRLRKTKFTGNDNARLFVKTYNSLLEVSSEINAYHDANITMTFFITFSLLVKTTSHALKMPSAVFGDPIAVMIPVSLMLTMNGHIIHVCHSAMDVAEKANTVLIKHVVYNNHNPNFDSSYAMLHLCAKKHLEFKMCKSMTINYNLGMSMIAAYITYTIILFQIDISSPATTPARFNSTEAP